MIDCFGLRSGQLGGPCRVGVDRYPSIHLDFRPAQDSELFQLEDLRLWMWEQLGQLVQSGSASGAAKKMLEDLPSLVSTLKDL